jgi:uncharacterized protein (TIGR02444 family)
MMMGAGQPIETESWEFALKLYAAPGIADACLRLQAECGVDVMMLLMATFAAVRRGLVLTETDIAAMDSVCRSWREQIVLPLRAIRTRLKTGPAPAPSTEAEKLRTSVKGAELHAERLQNELLAQWLAEQQGGEIGRADVIAVLHSLLNFAAQGKPASRINAELAAIEVIVDAALKLGAGSVHSQQSCLATRLD